MKGLIATIYRVEVTISKEFYRKHGHTEEYEKAVLACTQLADASGSNSYSELIEWGEFTNYTDAQYCLNKLVNLEKEIAQ